jgi:hypothetical protein
LLWLLQSTGAYPEAFGSEFGLDCEFEESDVPSPPPPSLIEQLKDFDVELMSVLSSMGSMSHTTAYERTGRGLVVPVCLTAVFCALPAAANENTSSSFPKPLVTLAIFMALYPSLGVVPGRPPWTADLVQCRSQPLPPPLEREAVAPSGQQGTGPKLPALRSPWKSNDSVPLAPLSDPHNATAALFASSWNSHGTMIFLKFAHFVHN